MSVPPTGSHPSTEPLKTAAQLGFTGYDGPTYRTSNGQTFTSDVSAKGTSWTLGDTTTIQSITYEFEPGEANGPGFYEPCLS